MNKTTPTFENPFQVLFEKIEALESKIDSLPFSNRTNSEEQTDLLTRKETADLLQINLATLHRWTKKGKLKSYGISNRIYYKRSEILNSIKSINHKK